MDYTKLVAGIALLAIFTWIVIRNGKRSGFIHALLGIDIILGLAAGFYLVYTSVHALLTP